MKLTQLTVAVLALSAPAIAQNQNKQADSLRARAIHKNLLTLDAHIDLRSDFNAAGNEASKETVDQLDLPKLERGELDVATIALFADPLKRSPENIVLARKQVDTKLASLKQWVAKHPDRLEFAYTSQDLERIPAKGKHAILLSFLNALSLGQDLTLIEKYYKEGVRVFGFTHVGNNDWADSSRPNAAFGDKPNENKGLTDLGKKGIGELNRLGIIIDVSQLTPAGVFQAIQLSKAPVIASHSAVFGRVENSRNLTNEELKAIAASGGVVHIAAFTPYLRQNPEFTKAYLKQVWEPFGITYGKDDPRQKLDAATYQKHLDAYREFSRNEWRYSNLTDYLDAVDYAVRLIGVDHVGFGSDFNHGGGVTGFNSVAEAPNVTRELLKRGYTEEEIRKLWGGNFLRVFKEVEAVAKQQQIKVALN
ncbi:MAG: dipeptidase [Cyclobacteriaceae bacterium]|nr:dipeptidase [Cyclobacteriaceae bacterium]